jgi:MFS family permease
MILAYISMVAFALVFQSIPPLMGQMIPSLNLSHTQAGALMSLFALPGIIISIPGGMLADRYGPGKVGAYALLLMVTGVLLTASGSTFAVLAAGRVIAGAGALTVAIVAPQAISRSFPKGELGTAMGLLNTAMPLGTIIAFNVFGMAAENWSWRVPVLFTAVFGALVYLIFIVKHPRGINEKETVPAVPLKFRDLGSSIWLTGTAWATFNAAGISFLTFAPDYYMTAGYGIGYAGFLASLFMLGSIFLSPIVGYLVDRVAHEELFIGGGCIILTILFLLVPRTGFNPLLLIVLIGLAASFIPPPVFSLVPKLLPAEKIGMGYGIVSTCLNIGVLLGPFLVGVSYDQSGAYVVGFSIMAVFSLLSVATVYGLKMLVSKK